MRADESKPGWPSSAVICTARCGPARGAATGPTSRLTGASTRAVVERAQREADDHSQIALAEGLLIGSQDCTREQAEVLPRNAAVQDEQPILEISQGIIEEHNSTL